MLCGLGLSPSEQIGVCVLVENWLAEDLLGCCGTFRVFWCACLCGARPVGDILGVLWGLSSVLGTLVGGPLLWTLAQTCVGTSGVPFVFLGFWGPLGTLGVCVFLSDGENSCAYLLWRG